MSFRDGPKDQTWNPEIPGSRLSTRPGMTARYCDRRHMGTNSAPRIFFTIFVDAIFTTLFERLFTNAFDVIGARSANHCVCRARHAD
jgi:hypothetical protein